MGKKTEKQFISELKDIHPNLELSSPFTNVNTRILITDELGITYNVLARTLLRGSKPSIMTAIDKNDATIKKFKSIHGDKYNYDKVVTDGKSQVHVIVNCPEHGDFNITPNNHNKGKGCKKCYLENSTSEYYENPMNWEKPSSCYFLRLWNDEEEFFKIGVSNNIKSRVSHIKRESGYNVEEIDSILTTVYDAHFNLEKSKHLKLNQLGYHYKPKHYFAGCMTECFKGEGLTVETRLTK